MSESLMSSLVEAGPAALVVIVVLIFLAYMRDQGKIARERDTRFADTLREIGDGCHEFQRDLSETTKEVVRENTDVLRENTKVMGEVAASLRRFESTGRRE